MKMFLRRHSMATPFLIVFLVALILLSMLMDSFELTYGLRKDLSFNALTTPSITTEEVLKEIQTPVHIYAVFKKGNEDWQLFELLNRYQAMGEHVTWEQTDLTLNPSLVSRFKGEEGLSVTQESVIVYAQETGRYRILQATDFVSLSYDVNIENYTLGLGYEKKLSEALLYVTRDEIYQIAILQGHHEMDADVLNFLTSYLASNHYDVSFVNLLEGDTLPMGALLMVLSPVRDITAAELDLLLEFARDGGAFYFSMDPGDPFESMPNYQMLLRLYGFEPMPGMAVADEKEKGTYFDTLPFVLIPNMEPTSITTPLIASLMDELWLVTPRAFSTKEQTDKELTRESVLTTSAGAYLAELDRHPLEKKPGDEAGPFSLALLSTRMMETTHLTRAFIVGSSGLLTNQDFYASTDAGPFILKTVQHLLDQSVLSLNIEQKPAIRPGLSAKAIVPATWLIMTVPLSVLIAALLVLLPRRHR